MRLVSEAARRVIGPWFAVSDVKDLLDGCKIYSFGTKSLTLGGFNRETRSHSFNTN